MIRISSGDILLVIGRLRVLPLTRTSTTRTRPSEPRYVCSMRPTFHCRLTVPGSITTTSPTRKLSLRKYHFCLDPICGKYSFIHRFLTCLVSSQIALSSPALSGIKWLGVRYKITTRLPHQRVIWIQDAVVVRVVNHSF